MLLAALPRVPGWSSAALTADTIEGYVLAVRPFLGGRLRDGDELDLGGLTAADVVAFVVARCPGQSRGAAKMTVTALRSLLGFLHLRGLIAGPLAERGAVDASWRLSGLPRALEPEQLEALLASLRPRHGDRAPRLRGAGDARAAGAARRRGRRAEARGRRLARRASFGSLGKGRATERLPLPADVGEAIVGYLRDGRPATRRTARCSCASARPTDGLTTGGVTQIVFSPRRSRRARPDHSHRLRHTAATAMLQRRREP